MLTDLIDVQGVCAVRTTIGCVLGVLLLVGCVLAMATFRSHYREIAWGGAAMVTVLGGTLFASIFCEGNQAGKRYLQVCYGLGFVIAVIQIIHPF